MGVNFSFLWKSKNLLSQKNISSNQLLSNSFSKNDALTKFSPKKLSVRAYFRNCHNLQLSCISHTCSFNIFCYMELQLTRIFAIVDRHYDSFGMYTQKLMVDFFYAQTRLKQDLHFKPIYMCVLLYSKLARCLVECCTV